MVQSLQLQVGVSRVHLLAASTCSDMTCTAELHFLLQELEAKNHALHELRLAHLSEDRDTATLRLEVDRLKALQPLLDGGLLHCHAAASMPCCTTWLLLACREQPVQL